MAVIMSRRQVLCHARLEPGNFTGEPVLAEEDRGVREVDHQLGRVFELDEKVFDVARLVHQVAPNTDMTNNTAATPVRSSVAVMVGTPWLSGSSPNRVVSTAT